MPPLRFRRREMLALSGLAILSGCETIRSFSDQCTDPTTAKGIHYVIQDGDTAEDIAQACSITVDELCFQNHMRASEFRAGRKILLPSQNYLPMGLREAVPARPLPDVDSKFGLKYPDLPGGSPIVRRSAWSAERTKGNVNPMTRIDLITLHHTSEYPGMNQLNDIQTIQAIARYHREHLGWADIGYHYLIGRDGKIYEGRPRQMQGAHVGGHNENNLGITVIGDFVKKLPSTRQLDTLKIFLSEQLKATHLGIGKLYGHRDLKPTQCPGEQLYRWLQNYRRHVV